MDYTSIDATAAGGPIVNHIQYIAESWKDADVAGWSGPGWYFWDETDAYCHGPYGSREEASRAMNKYAEQLNSLRND